MTLAGYRSRLGGYLLDSVIILVICIVSLIPFGGAFHDVSLTTKRTTSHFIIFGGRGLGLLVQMAVVLLYGTLFVGSGRGQTPGMRIVGIRCVSADADGNSIGHRRAFVRALVEQLLVIALFVPWVVNMLFPLWDRNKQTLHDKSVRSLVISVTNST